MEETQLLDSALDESETHYFSAEDEDEIFNITISSKGEMD